MCPYAPYIWMPPMCLDAPCMFKCHHMFGCIPCMFGCPMFGHLPYVWMPICMFGHPHVSLPHMFGWPLYVWVPPCLDTPLYGWMPPHVWTPPCMFGCPHYVLLPPICLDATKCMGASKGMMDIQTYRGCPNIQRHPNVWCIRTPPQSDKAHFLCVVYVQQASKHLPNIHEGIQTYGCVHTYSGASKHRGVQTYREYPNMWGCPKNMGHPNICRASKHMGLSQHTGGIPACLPFSQSRFCH